MKIVISSGHGKLIRGASGILDEVDEARKVVDRVAQILNRWGAQVWVFHDDVSNDQSENLNRIVDFHNSKTRDLDISVHFNAYENTSNPMGTECLFVSQEDMAAEVSAAIAHVSGLKNRGPKERDDLFFLNNTDEPAILIEVCFVDSSADAELYYNSFEEICEAIAEAVTGQEISVPPGETAPPVTERPPATGSFSVRGKASFFGGPGDTGVSPSEGLAFIFAVEDSPQLFLPSQPEGTTGLARRLNPYVHYVACRWDYEQTPKAELLNRTATVRSIKTGITLKAFCADWGPHEDTGRVADLSPKLMEDLGITTDDEVEVILS